MSKNSLEFKDIFDHEDVLKYLKSVDLKVPTSIQRKSISRVLEGGNFSIQGKTGSGKTLCFLLPIIIKLKEAEKSAGRPFAGQPKAVIVLPTRELALQVFEIAKGISHFAKLRIRKVIGGDKGKSLDSVFATPIDILITTPTRCMRAFKSGELKTDSLKYLVLDEADQLLESSFKKTMSEVTSQFKDLDIEVLLVSASRPLNFDEVIKEFFEDRKFTILGKGEENILNHKVDTYNLAVTEKDKFIYVKSFIKKQKKRSGIVFVGNKSRAKKLYEEIKKDSPKAFLIHKDFEVKERQKILADYRKSGGIIVATDIIARGVDIKQLEWVLNFDLPSQSDYYLHRCGRVGRAGRLGDVFNFITQKDYQRYLKINQALSDQGRDDLNISGKVFKK